MTTEPKLSPCACADCGKVPGFCDEPSGPSSVLIYHPVSDTCPTSKIVTSVWTISKWNEAQKLRRAQRKADFVAGARANGIGNRGPTKEMIEAVFEQYLTKEREK